MASRKQFKLKPLFLMYLCISVLCANECIAQENWQSIDRQIESKIFQLNVGSKMKFRQKFWVQVAGLSSKKHYYFFTTSQIDKGYQVVGRGSAFWINTNANKMFFLTSNHVLANAEQMKEECEMFYAAAALYAKRTAPQDKDSFDKLLNRLNPVELKDNKAIEKERQTAFDAIWDCYDSFLSKTVDPHRILFNQYKKLVPIEMQVAYFLHAPGGTSEQIIQAQAYKRAKPTQVDLAILLAAEARTFVQHGLQADFSKLTIGTKIQTVGYPVNQGADCRKQILRPIFSNGKITAVTPEMFQFDARINKGNSGSPVLNKKGNVIGVVTVRGVNKDGQILANRGGAVNMPSVKSLVPELFSK